MEWLCVCVCVRPRREWNVEAKRSSRSAGECVRAIVGLRVHHALSEISIQLARPIHLIFFSSSFFSVRIRMTSIRFDCWKCDKSWPVRRWSTIPPLRYIVSVTHFGCWVVVSFIIIKSSTSPSDSVWGRSTFIWVDGWTCYCKLNQNVDVCANTFQFELSASVHFTFPRSHSLPMFRDTFRRVDSTEKLKYVQNFQIPFFVLRAPLFLSSAPSFSLTQNVFFFFHSSFSVHCSRHTIGIHLFWTRFFFSLLFFTIDHTYERGTIQSNPTRMEFRNERRRKIRKKNSIARSNPQSVVGTENTWPKVFIFIGTIRISSKFNFQLRKIRIRHEKNKKKKWNAHNL